MKSRVQSLLAALLAAVALPATDGIAAGSEWVHPAPDGKLIYQTTPRGDRIMDFSHAGYLGGGVALPDVPVKLTVKPTGGDDTAVIQKAINEVAALKLENGFRGAVLLSPGVFVCSNTITISASGVVLRGSGSSGATIRTTIKLAGKPHNAITVRAGGTRNGEPGAKLDLAQTRITDVYVPSGTTKFKVADVAGFAIGDTIEIRRPVTEAWIKFMHMDDLVRDGKPQTWMRAGSTTTAERRIAAISGDTITVDVPLSDSFDSKYLNPPGTAVVKIRPPDRLFQVGIEHLHIECPPQEISHTQSHFTALRLNAEDAWVRDVVIDETMNSVGLNGRRITLQRVAVNRRARHQGSSKPAEFAPNASQVLLDRCTSTGDNVWYAATGGGVSGPIVLLNCTFLGNGRVESHQRWSTGMLYDNCRVPDGGLDFRNRGAMGSGHGWSMGWGVAWNCEAKDFVIQNPPGAINWMIGCAGESKPMPRPFDSQPNLPGGTQDSHGTHVLPPSLYLAQLSERLGAQGLKNLGAVSASPPPATGAPRKPPPLSAAAQATLARMTPIFDGKTLDGWVCPTNAWTVKDGAMASLGAGRGVIYTRHEYSNYRLVFTMRHVSGQPDHQACVLIYGTTPPARQKGLDALGAIQFQPPNGSGWDYRPGHNNSGKEFFTKLPHARFDPHEWSQIELLVSTNGTARMAVAQPPGTRAVEVLTFNDPTAGKSGPIAWQMHNTGLIDEYKDVRIEESPTKNKLVTTE